MKKLPVLIRGAFSMYKYLRVSNTRLQFQNEIQVFRGFFVKMKKEARKFGLHIN